jgi:hypothetical protein
MDCLLCSTFSVTKPEVLMIGLRTNHCPPIFTRLVSHATRFAMLGSPVLPTTVNTGKTSQLCPVGQTVVQYFVKPVVAITGGEGGIRFSKAPSIS